MVFSIKFKPNHPTITGIGGRPIPTLCSLPSHTLTYLRLGYTWLEGRYNLPQGAQLLKYLIHFHEIGVWRGFLKITGRVSLRGLVSDLFRFRDMPNHSRHHTSVPGISSPAWQPYPDSPVQPLHCPEILTEPHLNEGIPAEGRTSYDALIS